MSFQPDFSHRFTGAQADNFNDTEMVDTVLLMAERAAAMVNMISLQFMFEDSAVASNAINHSALCAVECEIQDMAAIVRAYHKQRAQKSPD